MIRDSPFLFAVCHLYDQFVFLVKNNKEKIMKNKTNELNERIDFRAHFVANKKIAITETRHLIKASTGSKIGTIFLSTIVIC